MITRNENKPILHSNNVTEEAVFLLAKTYNLDTSDIFVAIQNVLSKQIDRDVYVTERIDADKTFLQAIRVNKNGSSTLVTEKSFRKSKKALVKELERLAAIKASQKLLTTFKQNELLQGEVIDETENGFFIAAKGEKAFISKQDIFQSEIDLGLFSIGNKMLFQVKNVFFKKVLLTRKTVDIIENTLSLVTRHSLSVKLCKNKIILFCKAPYLTEQEMNIIRSNLPIKTIFKKIKDKEYV